MATPRAAIIDAPGAPLNPLDLLVASGSFHAARYDQLYVPGGECVGVVVASDRYDPGTRVYAQCHASPTSPGSLATQVPFANDDVVPPPGTVDPVPAVEASALAWLWAALADGLLQMPIRMFDLIELPNACAQQTLSPHAMYVGLPYPHLTGRSRK